MLGELQNNEREYDPASKVKIDICFELGFWFPQTHTHACTPLHIHDNMDALVHVNTNKKRMKENPS